MRGNLTCCAERAGDFGADETTAGCCSIVLAAKDSRG
jgi:hypothetical protein